MSATSPDFVPSGSDPMGTTRWNVLTKAKSLDGHAVQLAYTELFRQYWKPVYSYIYRLRSTHGQSTREIEDIAQGFFGYLFRTLVELADEEKGRFRDFIRTAARRYTMNYVVRENSAHRQPQHPSRQVPLEPVDGTYTLVFRDPKLSPDECLDLTWAMADLDEAWQLLVADNPAVEPKLRIYRDLTYRAAASKLTYKSAAELLKVTEPALRGHVRVFQDNLGRKLRLVVAQGIAGPSDIDEEIRHTLRVLQQYREVNLTASV